MPGAPSTVLVPSSFLLLEVRHLLLEAMPFAPSSVLVPGSKARSPLVAMPCVPFHLPVGLAAGGVCCGRAGRSVVVLVEMSHSRTEGRDPQGRGQRDWWDHYAMPLVASCS